MASHSSTLAWKIPCPVGHDWAPSLSLFTFMHWRRKWQPTPVFLPGEFQGQGSLVGFRLWGRTESDTTAVTQQQQRAIQGISYFLKYLFHIWGYVLPSIPNTTCASWVFLDLSFKRSVHFISFFKKLTFEYVNSLHHIIKVFSPINFKPNSITH